VASRRHHPHGSWQPHTLGPLAPAKPRRCVREPRRVQPCQLPRPPRTRQSKRSNREGITTFSALHTVFSWGGQLPAGQHLPVPRVCMNPLPQGAASTCCRPKTRARPPRACLCSVQRRLEGLLPNFRAPGAWLPGRVLSTGQPATRGGCAGASASPGSSPPWAAGGQRVRWAPARSQQEALPAMSLARTPAMGEPSRNPGVCFAVFPLVCWLQTLARARGPRSAYRCNWRCHPVWRPLDATEIAGGRSNDVANSHHCTSNPLATPRSCGCIALLAVRLV
jgi:hypothetical protein